MGARRRSVLCGLAVALAASGHSVVSGQAPKPGAAPRSIPLTQVVRGAGSCSATACHGGTRPTPDGPTSPPPIYRNEHDTWLGAGNHSKAYRVLTEPRSVAIAAKLPGATKATENVRCLACHSTYNYTPTREQNNRVLEVGIKKEFLRDGVTCESCHGPSQVWISKHTSPKEWPVGMSTDPNVWKFKEERGMVCNDNLVRRAENCAGCHVGAPAGKDGLPLRDVDHDLIAAGHPRLDFELSSFLSTMEKHWRDVRVPDGSPEFPARIWAIGQTASAKAALELLADRATRTQQRQEPSTWPEFTEFDCYACHHSLADQPWRKTFVESPAAAGRPHWGTWHYPMLEVLAAAEAKNPGATTIPAALNELKAVMLEPRPDAAKVAALATTASQGLKSWLDELSASNYKDPARIQRLLTAYKDLQQQPGRIKNWDEATQRYLALVPLGQAYSSLATPGGKLDPKWAEELARLKKFIVFPSGRDGPDPIEFDPTRTVTTP
jgi:hypothetical protein